MNLPLPPRLLSLCAGLASFGMLLGAWGFQYIGSISPCPMCIWQRWPHALAALIGVLAFSTGWLRLPALAGALTMAVSTALGIFHSGVERDWWEGPSTCTSGSIEGLSSEQLMDQIMSAPLVRCDEIAWSLFGLTMPNYNALISLCLLALWACILIAAAPSARQRH